MNGSGEKYCDVNLSSFFFNNFQHIPGIADNPIVCKYALILS